MLICVHILHVYNESDRGHDIVPIRYKIIHVVVSGKFCSKMYTGVHKLVLCRTMIFIAIVLMQIQ